MDTKREVESRLRRHRILIGRIRRHPELVARAFAVLFAGFVALIALNLLMRGPGADIASCVVLAITMSLAYEAMRADSLKKPYNRRKGEGKRL